MQKLQVKLGNQDNCEMGLLNSQYLFFFFCKNESHFQTSEKLYQIQGLIKEVEGMDMK